METEVQHAKWFKFTIFIVELIIAFKNYLSVATITDEEQLLIILAIMQLTTVLQEYSAILYSEDQ